MKIIIFISSLIIAIYSTGAYSGLGSKFLDDDDIDKTRARAPVASIYNQTYKYNANHHVGVPSWHDFHRDRNDIKEYLNTYKNMLLFIRDNRSSVNLLSGDYDELAGPQLQAAIEVLALIVNGDLDDCCWVGMKPKNTPFYGYPVINTDNIGQVTQWYDSSNRPRYYHGNMNLEPNFKALYNIIVAYDYPIPKDGTADVYDAESMTDYEEKMLLRLLFIWHKLYWAFSYVDDSVYRDGSMPAAFRNNYAFACLVCFNSGIFYDTAKLHTLSSRQGG